MPAKGPGIVPFAAVQALVDHRRSARSRHTTRSAPSASATEVLPTPTVPSTSRARTSWGLSRRMAVIVRRRVGAAAKNTVI